jgi:hypothetical protein
MAWYAEAGSYVHLSEINRVFLRHIARHLEITPTFVDVESILSDDEHDALGPTERLVEICRRLGATSYLSGPAAKQYVDQALFDAASIAVEWFNYEGYPVYPQLHGSFEHAVSVLDPLLMLGPQARAAIVRNNGYAISTGHDPLVPADA